MPIHVLIVDDNPEIEPLLRAKFRQKLRTGEWEFSFASNGQEALATLKADAGIEILVSDLYMPVIDGFRLLEQVAALSRQVKTIIVSDHTDLRNVRAAMNRGAYDFLTKPIDVADFEATICRADADLDRVRRQSRIREETTSSQQELSVASRIQLSMLPRVFPAFPDRRDFEVFAEMIPARQVGGDFYDFFLIDKERLGFVIGDVAGKGVPAAIFMAVTRTLLRAAAMEGRPPGECLAYVNQILARQREAATYVTMFYCILHTATGELEYAICGHEPAFVIMQGEPIASIREPSGFLCGAFEGARFETGHIKLRPASTIVLYTNGVVRATNAQEQELSTERLIEVLHADPGTSAEQVVRRVLSQVRFFTNSTPQLDDLTILAVRYNG